MKGISNSSEPIKVDRNCQGILFSNINLGTTIEVVSVTNRGRKKDFRYPSMSVRDLISIFYPVQVSKPVLFNGVLNSFFLPFSLEGFLAFDDDNYLEVFISASRVSYELIYSPILGYPVVIERSYLENKRQEKVLNVKGVEAVYMPFSQSDNFPVEFEYAIDGRSQGISLSQVEFINNQIDFSFLSLLQSDGKPIEQKLISGLSGLLLTLPDIASLEMKMTGKGGELDVYLVDYTGASV